MRRGSAAPWRIGRCSGPPRDRAVAGPRAADYSSPGRGSRAVGAREARRPPPRVSFGHPDEGRWTMLEDVRKYVEAALGTVNQSRARELAGSMLRGQPTEQVNRLAMELVGWSQRTRERLTELVQAEVRRQLRSLGLATRDDLDTVRARV